MEIQESRQKGTNTLKPYRAFTVEVPAKLSRQKAIQYAKDHCEVRGGNVDPIPHPDVRAELYMLYMKIGATGELPTNVRERDSFLNDFWVTFYFRNNLCPVDIPFDVIINEFTTAMVQGTVDRKGNNQAALCRAFNEWIIRQDTRNHLYQVRDRKYPDKKPKQVAANATPETVKDYSDEELAKKIKDIEPMAGIGMVDQMIKKLKEEQQRRK